MRRSVMVVVLVVLSAGAFVWKSKSADAPFALEGIRVGADITEIAQSFPGADRTTFECIKIGEFVECVLPWSAIDAQLIALVNQDHEIQVMAVLPRYGHDKLAAAIDRAQAGWQRFPHGSVEAPIGEGSAMRWTSRDERWSAMVGRGRLEEDVPDLVILADEKRVTPQMRERIERYVLIAAAGARGVNADMARLARERLTELAEESER